MYLFSLFYPYLPCLSSLFPHSLVLCMSFSSSCSRFPFNLTILTSFSGLCFVCICCISFLFASSFSFFFALVLCCSSLQPLVHPFLLAFSVLLFDVFGSYSTLICLLFALCRPLLHPRRQLRRQMTRVRCSSVRGLSRGRRMRWAPMGVSLEPRRCCLNSLRGRR